MDRTSEIYRVTLVGSAGNLLLLSFKFVAGFLGHSSAMIADAVHSLSDFFTDVIVLLFVKVSSRPQDESHDYGHGKFETVATLFIGLALIAAAVGIIVSGGRDFYRWYNGETLEMPGKLALWAALISIAVKEILYRYTAAKGCKLNAPVVVANAWHHRSDALSSIGAAIGIGGAIILGQKWAVLDPIASIVVGLMLIRVSWRLMKGSIGELTDQSLSPQEEKEITDIIHSYPEVSEPHNLRTRRIGNRVAIEVHIRMEGETSLNDAHNQATEIERKLKDRFGKDTLVTLHMEPRKQ
ncbi:MAG: cation transporter [Bacteroidales bacterium]|nr:cation transporter [Bacteroidales bacterium]